MAVEEGSKILFLKMGDWGAIRESYKHEGRLSPFHYSADLVKASMTEIISRQLINKST
ncbi:hypothetical protein [Neochlamydia sp. S13]|uniref:hypothetical protein n=1 Tax=Neochlamydia sp. S13 TaxID=1353976 RepID=UPI000FD18489|nr:hypothetical protein [Neochlamydia sp. S13]BBI16995.1 hypothetical protein NCS13_1_0800 [Neochlamydia sp. S13]